LAEELEERAIPATYPSAEVALTFADRFCDVLETHKMSDEAKAEWYEKKELIQKSLPRDDERTERAAKRHRSAAVGGNESYVDEHGEPLSSDESDADDNEPQSNHSATYDYYKRGAAHLGPLIKAETTYELLRDIVLSPDAAKKYAHQLSFVRTKAQITYAFFNNMISFFDKTMPVYPGMPPTKAARLNVSIIFNVSVGTVQNYVAKYAAHDSNVAFYRHSEHIDRSSE
jgi:hypothetical protein